ncbi:MAG TPA: DUF433 domain-containing protein [Firmicutes bacterium]|nr:DUF433 domain-containing protein [Bacillota bacterium]
MSFSRIVRNAKGIPCIRNTNIPVTAIVQMATSRITVPGIRAKYPELSEEDIYEALAFATDALLRNSDD